ncbi:MAG TPA: serine/threonine-protein kinase [Gemmataceae bacterium]|jgi:serine/threonine protein kinase|nr:serine/threonine-protein kinase [Gemmataceae bacterium]
MPSPEGPSPFETVGLPPTPAQNALTLADGSATALLPAPKIVGDYEILTEIARGGMGVVFQARQRSANRVVALKMILSGNLAGQLDVRRFRTEAEAAAGLDHPNILPVYEVGEHEGRPFFSMKLATGGSLADRVTQLVSDPTAAATLVAKLARAVHFAHQRGILHRDLKPANVLLDGDDTPLITDFGLAKRTGADSGMTQSGAIVGTPSYMAPEQARSGKAVTTASDVYALGAILYELLAGQPPFRGETVMDTLYLVMDQAPKHPRATNAQADRDLSAVALKCLEKRPTDRYESAGELADELERWLAGEPTHARPLSPPDQLWRWLRRHTTAAFTLPALGIVLGIWPAFLAQPDIAPELLPTSLTTPLGWYRLLKINLWAYAAVSIISAFIFAAFGWLVVRVTRPKTVAATFGFAASVALVASISSSMITAPLMTEQARDNVVTGQSRVHPVDDPDPDKHWFHDTRVPGTKEYAEAEYLKRFLPPEKQGLDYEGWQEDMRKLRLQASMVNRLRADYRTIGDEVLYGTVGTVLWAVFSTWVVVFLDRAYGRRWSNLVRYVELTSSTLFAVSLTVVTAIGSVQSRDLGFFVVTAGYFAIVAVVAWVGIVRRWRWWVRWLLYFGCTVGLIIVAALIAVYMSAA